MCGVAGLVSGGRAGWELYDVLTILQHRGQDAAGIMTSDGNRLALRKGRGLVRDLFTQTHMEKLRGGLGIGHVRYPTAGTDGSSEAQPFYVNSPYGLSLAHNGNLLNTDQLAVELFSTDHRHINTSSDSEVLLNVFAHELQKTAGLKPTPDDFFSAVGAVHERCLGAYAAVMLIADYGVLAFRDPNGIRPLVYGERRSADGLETLIASESAALEITGFEFVADLEPGEALLVLKDGRRLRRQCAQSPRHRPCIFEHVYLARPDSIIDGVSVYKARLRMGERLVEKIRRRYPDNDIDVVIPVPETSCTVALPMAHALGVKYREGLVKNRYIGRTFIMPGQQVRNRSVRQKFNVVGLEVGGKNVLLVDDSIVRGTTLRKIVEMVREAGARRVYVCSASPPVRHPNVYGIDIPVAGELIAHQRTEAQIAAHFGADWLVYQDLDDLLACGREGNSRIRDFDASVFDGNYVTGGVDAAYLERLSRKRNNSTRVAAHTSVAGGDCESLEMYDC